jgi:DNA-binding CsgD family transcriptional regulator
VKLSKREQEVADMVAAGMSNREIAIQCSVTVKTVKFHMTNIMAKLGIHSRAQLIAKRLRAQRENSEFCKLMVDLLQ